MRKKFFGLLFISFFVVASASADPCLDPDDINYNPFCEDPDAPIDSGVGLLIGAATFYTVRKIRDKKGRTDQSLK
jgi:hypothetical protein